MIMFCVFYFDFFIIFYQFRLHLASKGLTNSGSHKYPVSAKETTLLNIIYSRTSTVVMKMNFLNKLVLFLGLVAFCNADALSEELVEESGRYVVEGKVYPPEFSGNSRNEIKWRCGYPS